MRPAELRDDLVVLSNRLPLAASPDDAGTVRWAPSPGGLVATLEPVLSRRPSRWLGWTGAAAETGVRLRPVDAQLGLCRLHEVPLRRDLVRMYYEGFANATLWPLYHGAAVAPEFDRRTWSAYVAANRTFASHAAELSGPGATVWVHDAQLQLVPSLLREMRPDLTIGFFLHVPFPPAEDFASLPWRRAVLEGVLGADLVGFQTSESAHNFTTAVARVLGHEVADTHVRMSASGPDRDVRVGVFPASIDVDRQTDDAQRAEVVAAARSLRRALGSPRHLLLGVDRLDYTKGIDVRLHAFRRLLSEGRMDPASTVLLQVATPSRAGLPQYRRFRDEIATLVGRTIGESSTLTGCPLHYLNAHLDRRTLTVLYAAADVMLVTPYRDGMNLVCKEYVASRVDGDGALVLSEFAGAAAELGDHAFLVNPHDVDAVTQAVLDATRAPAEDLRRRMSAMRRRVAHHDVHRWAAEYLAALVTASSSAHERSRA